MCSVSVLQMSGYDPLQPRQYYVQSRVEAVGPRFHHFADPYSRVTLSSPSPTISPIAYVPAEVPGGRSPLFEASPVDRTNLQLWMADRKNWCPSWDRTPILNVDAFLYFEAVLMKTSLRPWNPRLGCQIISTMLLLIVVGSGLLFATRLVLHHLCYVFPHISFLSDCKNSICLKGRLHGSEPVSLLAQPNLAVNLRQSDCCFVSRSTSRSSFRHC